MAVPRTILNIFGPSAAGKSTLVQMLQDEIEGMYTVDFDIIKRQISGYHWERDSRVAQQISFDTLRSVAKTGMSIICLLPPPNESEHGLLTQIAEKEGYSLQNIELVAPREVLIARYQKRLEEIKASGSKWKFKTLDEYKLKLEKPYYRPANTISFDSSQLSPDEIFNKVTTMVAS
jgi:adenylylsulfate kinase-like enzyme